MAEGSMPEVGAVTRTGEVTGSDVPLLSHGLAELRV